MGSHWSHWKVQSSLCALAVSNGRGSIVSFTFPYIFLLVDCFKWALIGHIEKWRVHSVLWQFRMGGFICLWYLYVFSMHWYFLIFSYKLTVSNWLSLVTLNSKEFTQWTGSFEWGEGGSISFTPLGVNLKIWAHLQFSALLHRRSFRITYERPNEVFTLSSGSFKWGGQIYPPGGKSENLNSFQVLLLLHRLFLIFSY